MAGLGHPKSRFESLTFPVDGEVGEVHLPHVQVLFVGRFIEIRAESGQAIGVEIDRQGMDVRHQHVHLR